MTPTSDGKAGKLSKWAQEASITRFMTVAVPSTPSIIDPPEESADTTDAAARAMEDTPDPATETP